jgi:hypothetical protein
MGALLKASITVLEMRQNGWKINTTHWCIVAWFKSFRQNLKRGIHESFVGEATAMWSSLLVRLYANIVLRAPGGTTLDSAALELEIK